MPKRPRKTKSTKTWRIYFVAIALFSAYIADAYCFYRMGHLDGLMSSAPVTLVYDAASGTWLPLTVGEHKKIYLFCDETACVVTGIDTKNGGVGLGPLPEDEQHPQEQKNSVPNEHSATQEFRF